MKKNIIFYFSGTGNSLKVAKEVSASFASCELVSMACNANYILDGDYERVGFIYPTYFTGIPKKVRDFATQLKVNQNKDTYYFALTTYGGTVGNGTSDLRVILQKKNIQLQYEPSLKMVDNYVMFFKMPKDPSVRTKQAEDDLKPIIKNIQAKKQTSQKSVNPLFSVFHKVFMNNVHEKDKHFKVADSCISCGLCADVCPVKNIKMKNGLPEYRHQCEQCLACLHFCPEQAINYRKGTQKNGRYTCPGISAQELQESNHTK